MTSLQPLDAREIKPIDEYVGKRRPSLSVTTSAHTSRTGRYSIVEECRCQFFLGSGIEQSSQVWPYAPLSLSNLRILLKGWIFPPVYPSTVRG